MCLQSVLERVIHARLPAWASGAKSGQHVVVKADGHLLFGGYARLQIFCRGGAIIFTHAIPCEIFR